MNAVALLTINRRNLTMATLEEKLEQVLNRLTLTKQHLKTLEDEQESLKAQIVKERFGFGIGDILTSNDATPIQVTSILVVGDLIFGKTGFIRFEGFKQKKDGTIGKNPGYAYYGPDLKKIG